jgi:Esterase-like activity of phytase
MAKRMLTSISMCLTLVGLVWPASAAPILFGEASIPGTTLDNSGLTGLLEDGRTPHNLAGGLGSAITYTGSGTSYVMLPDRGPADGATSYKDRLYTVNVPLSPVGGPTSSPSSVTANITSTRLLTNEAGHNFTGSSAAINTPYGNGTTSLRLDPEGVAVRGNAVYISDEYGSSHL